MAYGKLTMKAIGGLKDVKFGRRQRRTLDVIHVKVISDTNLLTVRRCDAMCENWWEKMHRLQAMIFQEDGG